MCCGFNPHRRASLTSVTFCETKRWIGGVALTAASTCWETLMETLLSTQTWSPISSKHQNITFFLRTWRSVGQGRRFLTGLLLNIWNILFSPQPELISPRDNKLTFHDLHWLHGHLCLNHRVLRRGYRESFGFSWNVSSNFWLQLCLL